MRQLQSGTESRVRLLARSTIARSSLSLILASMLILLGVGMISPAVAARVTADILPRVSDAGSMRSGADVLFSDATSTWSNFQPTGWTTSNTPACTVTIADSEGLQQSTARYRYSTNGGSSWTGWSNAGLAISGGLTTTKYITVTGASFLESAAQNQIQFYILDTVGLTDTSPIYTVKVDATAPGAPTDLAAAPAGWTNANSFNLTWTNPSDVSNISGAYYKLDTAPTSAADGTYVAGNDIESISSISVTGDGEHPIYVWLQDTAGNRDHTQRAMATLYYDGAAPGSPVYLAATPAGWSNVNSFDLSWTNPAGDAPIAGAYYKLDSPPASPSDGGFVVGVDMQTLEDVAVAGAGAHDVFVWLRDEAGNVDHANRSQTTLAYDAEAPTGPTVFTSTSHVVATWSGDNTIEVTWSGAADAHSGIGGYALLWDRSPTTMPTPVTTTIETSGVSPALESGNDHYAHLRTMDNAGNWTAGAWHLGPFYIHGGAPAAPIGLAADPVSWAKTNAFDLTWENPDNVAGIAGAYYKLDSPPLFETDGAWVEGDDIESLEDIAVSGDGIHPIYVWLKDHAGNVSVSNRSSTDLHLDTFRPGAPTSLMPDPSGWSNESQFGISWTNPWDLSGISGAFYKLDAEPLSSSDGVWVTTTNTISDVTIIEEGEHDIYLWLSDTAGNADYRTRNILLNAFKYDASAPNTVLQADGTLGQAGWYTTPVYIELQTDDSLSGVDETWHRIDAGSWLSPTTFSLSASGTYTVAFYSEDVAGNEETVQTEYLQLDWLAPTTDMIVAGTLGDNGWYTSEVQVTLDALDAISGISLTRHRVDGGAWLAESSFPLETDGIHQIEFYSVDNAGNSEDIQSESLLVDAQPPITLHSIDGEAGESDWYRSAVTVTLMPTDLASGPAATYYQIDSGNWISGTQFIVSEEGMHTAQFYTRDYAGNVEEVDLIAVNVDTAPPSPPYGLASSPQGWTSINSYTITWNSLADASGIAGAYYKLNAEPISDTDGAYQAGVSDMIHGVQVPAEGKYTVYLWLRDGAGNVNYQTRNVLNQALWYDATPPTTTIQLAGSLGQNGWYTSVVQANFSAVDERSGVDRYYHRLLGDDWSEGQSFQVTTPGRHTVQYFAVDNAGNEETPQASFVKVDLEPPASPIGLRAGQSGWQEDDAFSVTWTDPVDTSLIGAAYYKLDAPPAFATDGEVVSAPLGEIEDIEVATDGKHSIYVWLVDNAGNLDHTHYASVIDAFWYDSRPPTTTHTISGTMGLGDWYRSPVTVTLSAVDLGSGPAATVYRVNSGSWKTGNSFSIDAGGQHVVQYYSTDAASNSEALHTLTVKIDTLAPSSMVTAPSGYQENNVVTVEWSGSDPQSGSGILYYDVQYKDGKNGVWVAWRTATDEVSDVFVGERGHIYYFRSRASDLAGNVEPFPAGYGDRQIYVEPVDNGRFETQNFSDWTTGGALNTAVESISGHAGENSYMAILGNPELGPCYDTLPPVLPTGSGVISQTVYVPGTPDVVVPTLRFWYHIMTYDTVWSERYQRYYDSFDVELSVAGSSTRQVLLRDGNYDPNKVGSGKPVTDLGWKEAEIDLSGYAGQIVTLYFTVSNRVDQYFNTWAYLDEVSIVDMHTGSNKVFLPLSTRLISGAAMVQNRLDRVTSSAGADPPR